MRYSWIDLLLLLTALVILIPLSMHFVETVMDAFQGMN